MTSEQGDTLISLLQAVGLLLAQAVNLAVVVAMLLAALLYIASCRRWF